MMQYDYGDASRSRSYEYTNYYHSLIQSGYEVFFFDFMSVLQQHGKKQMNVMLLELTKEIQPDLVIFHLYTDQFEVATVEQLRQTSTTLSIFHDDTWRKNFTQKWAPHFDFFTTPDIFSLSNYLASGLGRALLFPYGCNETLYYKTSAPKLYDVSFVGRWHPYRQWLVGKIEKAGIPVNARGPGWRGGMIDHDEMVAIFNQSKINLNFSNSASWDIRYLCSSHRAIVDRLRSQKTVEQLKARHFEIAGCCGFQLSYYVAGLEKLYLLGEEIAIYISPEDLIDKIGFYLRNDEMRQSIANAAYQRTLAEHTYSKRFHDLFKLMGFGNV